MGTRCNLSPKKYVNQLVAASSYSRWFHGTCARRFTRQVLERNFDDKAQPASFEPVSFVPQTVYCSGFSVSFLCHCWCPPLFLFICLPGLSLLVSALFRWLCSISIHFCLPLLVSALFRWPCSISIHPCLPLLVSALFRWPCSIYSLVSQVCHWWCPPFSAGDATFLLICFLGLSLVVSAACHVAFLFICLPSLSLLVCTLFRWPCLLLSSFLSPFLLVIVSALSPFLLCLRSCLQTLHHCVRLVSLLLLLSHLAQV